MIIGAGASHNWSLDTNHIQACPDIFRHVQTYPDLSRTCPDISRPLSGQWGSVGGGLFKHLFIY